MSCACTQASHSAYLGLCSLLGVESYVSAHEVVVSSFAMMVPLRLSKFLGSPRFLSSAVASTLLGRNHHIMVARSRFRVFVDLPINNDLASLTELRLGIYVSLAVLMCRPRLDAPQNLTLRHYFTAKGPYH